MHAPLKLTFIGDIQLMHLETHFFSMKILLLNSFKLLNRADCPILKKKKLKKNSCYCYFNKIKGNRNCALRKIFSVSGAHLRVVLPLLTHADCAHGVSSLLSSHDFGGCSSSVARDQVNLLRLVRGALLFPSWGTEAGFADSTGWLLS